MVEHYDAFNTMSISALTSIDNHVKVVYIGFNRARGNVMLRKTKSVYVVDYSYRDGGNFERSFSQRPDALALCRELMASDAIAWVQCLHRGSRVFPSPTSI